MNSGDWIENFSALEYIDKKWELFIYTENKTAELEESESEKYLSIVSLRENLIRSTMHR